MKVERLEKKAWLSFLHKCEGSTFFHTHYWYKVWQAYKGYQYEARLYTFSDGQKVIFPFAWRPRFKGLFKELLSGPAGVYGGPLSPQTISKDKFTLIWQNLKRDFDTLNIRLCPYQEVELGEEVNQQSGFTQTLFVNEKSIDELILNYSNNHKRSLKTRKKNKLEIYYTDSLREWFEYYAVYQGCVKRWGEQATNAYEFELFELIQDLPPELFRLWICRNECNIIAGALVFYFNKNSIYWHGATDAGFYNLKPMHILQTSIIEALIKENLVKYYDFNPSGGHEGVIRFKKGFGAAVKSSTLLKQEGYLLKRIQKAHNYIKNVYHFFS